MPQHLPCPWGAPSHGGGLWGPSAGLAEQHQSCARLGPGAPVPAPGCSAPMRADRGPAELPRSGEQLGLLLWSWLCRLQHPLPRVRDVGAPTCPGPGISQGSLGCCVRGGQSRALLLRSSPGLHPAELPLPRELLAQHSQRGARSTFQTFPSHVVELCLTPAPWLRQRRWGALALRWDGAGTPLPYPACPGPPCGASSRGPFLARFLGAGVWGPLAKQSFPLWDAAHGQKEAHSLWRFPG